MSDFEADIAGEDVSGLEDCGEEEGTEDLDESASQAGSSAGGNLRERARAAAKAATAAKQRGRMHKAKNGEKWCPGCGKYLPVSSFPAGKKLCSPDTTPTETSSSAPRRRTSWSGERRPRTTRIS